MPWALSELTVKYPGGFAETLKRAGINARRSRDKDVSDVTLDFWQELLIQARQRVAKGGRGATSIEQRASELEAELEFQRRRTHFKPGRGSRFGSS